MEIKEAAHTWRSRARADLARLILDRITTPRQSLRETLEGCRQAPTILQRRDELAETHPAAFAVEP